MTRRGDAIRLTVFVKESDQWRHRPVYSEIVHRAHRDGLAGASVFRGIEGFGRSGRIHTTRILSLSEDLPVAVVVVDTEEKIRAFLAVVADLVSEGLAMVDRVEVIRYDGRGADDEDDG